MKVLFFTKYTRLGASSRLRTFQYLPHFSNQGIECTVNSLFDDDYLNEVYKFKRHNKWLALKGFVRRLEFILKAKNYDRVVIEKELFPYFPALPEWFLRKIGIRYIVDYDDAIFHNYDVARNPLVRWLFSNKIKRVIRFADTVVVGNLYLHDMATLFGAKRVVIIPTVVDTDRYPVRKASADKTFTIGWIGSPITFKYLTFLRPVFSKLIKKYNFRIVYVGSGSTLNLPNEEFIPWSEKTETEIIGQFDVGIMPLEDNIWERGKCGYKLIQYMACGVPVVGTPIGANRQIIRDGYNGFHATTPEEWENAFVSFLKSDEMERQTMGLNGRRLVEEKYSLKRFQSTWLNLLISRDSRE